MSTAANRSCVGRTSGDVIVLTSEERSSLEAIAGRLKAPFRDVQRARIVLYAADGLPNCEIAARLDTTPGVVAKWRRRFCEDRVEGLKDKPRAGRPCRFPPEQVAEVKAVACELPKRYGLPLAAFSRSELHRFIVERARCAASASTIGRWLAEDAI